MKERQRYIGIDFGTTDYTDVVTYMNRSGDLFMLDKHNNILNGDTMKKKKQKPLTKDQKKINELQDQLCQKSANYSALQYNHEKLIKGRTETEQAAQEAERKASDSQRRYDILIAQVRKTHEGLAAVGSAASSQSELQRAIGMAQGQLSAIIGITDKRELTGFDSGTINFLRK